MKFLKPKLVVAKRCTWPWKKESHCWLCLHFPVFTRVALLFLYPMVQSIIFSFHSIQIGTQGYEMTGAGFSNYYRAFMVHPTFRRVLVESILQMITDAAHHYLQLFCGQSD